MPTDSMTIVRQRRSTGLTIGLLWLALLLLASCRGGETPTPTETRPTVSAEEAPTADSHSSSDETTVPTRSSTSMDTPTTAELAGDLEAIDTVVEEIDNKVCQKALETRAEIEKLLQEGQDVTDLLGAMDELIEELEGCDLSPSPE